MERHAEKAFMRLILIRNNNYFDLTVRHGCLAIDPAIYLARRG